MRACLCIVRLPPPTPLLSTLSPYLEPGWPLQMARLRRSLLDPIPPPLSVSKCGIYARGPRIYCGVLPACGASSSPRRLWPFKLKAAAQETPPPASSDAVFQILSVFYLLSVNLLAEAEKRGRNMSPSARLKPGAWMCVCGWVGGCVCVRSGLG